MAKRPAAPDRPESCELAEGNICNGGSQVAAPQQKATVQLAPNEIVSEAADKNFNAKQQDEVAEKERKYEMPEAAKIGQFKLALNPDVLTDAYPASWERDETLKKQEEDVRACSKFLHDVIIPAFVNEAISDSNIHFDSRALTEQMHKFGINMRCLGRIALMLAKEDDPKAVLLKNVVIHEMLVRSSKRLLRSFLRGIKFVHAGGCVAHFLNCFLGEQLNAQPRPALSLDEELAEWEDHAADKRSTKRDYRLLTPLGLRRAIQQDIAERYRYRLPDNVFDMDGGVGGFNRLSVLRGICLSVGVQMKCRDYVFTREKPDGNITEHKKHWEETNRKQGKRTRSHSSETEDLAAQVLTFLPEDVLNLFPIVKQAAPSSAVAVETFNAGNCAFAQGQKELGWELLGESIAIHEHVYGLVHPEVAKCYASVAMAHYQSDMTESAVDLQKRAVVIFERTIGFDSHEALHGYINLGLYEYSRGCHNTALRYLLHARELAAVVSGPIHLEAAIMDNNIGMVLQAGRDFERSLSFFESSRDSYSKLYGADHIATANSCHHVARARFFLQDYKAALENERAAFKVFKAVYGEDHPRTKESGRWLQEFTKNAVVTAKTLKHISSRCPFGSSFRPAQLPRPTAYRVRAANANAMASLASTEDFGVASMGHLPIDELVTYINRPATDTTRARKAARKQKKQTDSP